MSSYCADQADWVQLGPVSCAHTHARTLVCVCVLDSKQDAYTGGMSIPFVGPWEQSSISLLGTALMRPGILPFIPHSLQLGTAHSFRYGHSKVFVYTETMQLARAAHPPPTLPHPSEKQRPCPCHPTTSSYTCCNAAPQDSGEVFPQQQQQMWMLCLCNASSSPPAQTHGLPENAKKGHMFVICRLS